MSRRRAGAGLAVAAAVALLGRVPARAADEQPTSRPIFFPEPDERTRAQIEDVVDKHFGDVGKAPYGRELLVARFGFWAVPVLADRLRAGANETVVRNAALTLGALRRERGPSPCHAPAVPALTAVLRRDGTDPWRRAFAALALGTFYGPETVRRGPGSREGSRAVADAMRDALVEADAALLKALGDPNGAVSAAASLALGKVGGMRVFGARAASRKANPLPATPEARVADLLCTGLLPGDDDRALAEALRHEDRRVRAAAALGIACWAVATVEAAPTGALAADAAARARAFDALLRPERNPLLRELRDGAEALFARAALALVTDRAETFAELLDVALRTTDDEIALAAAQGLLFAPRQSPVRGKLVELLRRENVGRALREPVIAAALLVAGSDGTDAGVEACREYLRDRGRQPHGRADWDVRFHGVLGLVRALRAGRVAPATRPLAASALSEAARQGLVDDPKGDPRGFRPVLRDLARTFVGALDSNPDAVPDPAAAARLEAAFADPTALDAADPVDVVVDRLNDQVTLLFGLDGLGKAASGGPGSRQPNTADQELRFLLAYVERYPYFQRIDLRADRGRVPPPALPAPGPDVLDTEPARGEAPR